jgi:hypothetical protein
MASTHGLWLQESLGGPRQQIGLIDPGLKTSPESQIPGKAQGLRLQWTRPTPIDPESGLNSVDRSDGLAPMNPNTRAILVNQCSRPAL